MHQVFQAGAMRTRVATFAIAAIMSWGASVTSLKAAITEAQVLVVYNSASADGTALKNSYLAAHPGIPANHVFNLNDASLLVSQVTYADFVAKIRNPIRNYLTSLGAAELQSIISIVLIRPIPHRVFDSDNVVVGDNPSGMIAEFLPPGSGGQADVTYASVDAELVLLWQNLDAGEAGGAMDSKSDNLIDNPYHMLSTEIHTFSRANIQTQKTLATFGGLGVTWVSSGAGATALTSGDLYLVCRIDAPSLAAAQASIGRAQNLYANKATQIILLDAYDGALAGGWIDNGALYTSGDPFNAGIDYSDTRTVLQGQGWTVRYDTTTNFVDPPEETRTLIGFASYGENHSANGAGDNPAGDGTYPTSGYRYGRGAIFNPLESYSGRDLNGLGQHPGIPQGQVGDFIGAGGTFAVGLVWEPLSFAVADNEFIMQRMLVNQRTWAEAAYSGIPVLSWQHVVLGDPLGRFQAILNDPGLPKGDMDGSGSVNGRDIHWFVQVMTQGIAGYRTAFPTLDPIARGDFTNDLVVDAADVPAFRAALLAP